MIVTVDGVLRPLDEKGGGKTRRTDDLITLKENYGCGQTKRSAWGGEPLITLFDFGTEIFLSHSAS